MYLAEAANINITVPNMIHMIPFIPSAKTCGDESTSHSGENPQPFTCSMLWFVGADAHGLAMFHIATLPPAGPTGEGGTNMHPTKAPSSQHHGERNLRTN